MQDRVTYEFVVVRFVPVVEREEFLNVGVILFSKRKKYLKMKYTIDGKRLEAFSKDIDLELLQNYLKAWDSICLGTPHGGVIGEFEKADRFRWLAATKSTMLQCSRPHPGLCSDPDFELEDLFTRFVK